MHKASIATAALIAGAMSLPASAQTQVDPEEVNVVGVIVATGQSVYDDTGDTGSQVFPLVYLRKGNLKVTGKEATYDLASSGNFTFSALGDLRIAGYDDSETALTQGMEAREDTLELGGQIAYRIGNFEAVAKVRADVLGRHEGYDLALQGAYQFEPWLGNFTRPYAGIALRSEDLNNYYFGVPPEEALSPANDTVGQRPLGRPVYSPGEAAVPYVGVLAIQAVSEKIALGLVVNHQWLPEEITDSPIVDRDAETSVLFMVGYIF